MALSQSFEKMDELPSKLSESSGLEAINNNLFLTHNDGGDAARVYFLDSLGVIQREVLVANSRNVDWEDISVASDGRVFIGNFGNNGSNREDLEILILPDYRKWLTDTVDPETITFKYGDQTVFPPPASNKVFDCEAIAFYQDSLYLFNKNWSSPFSGMTKMYVLPAKPGDYTVYPRDSVHLGMIKEIAWVTAADISDSTLYLLGSAFIWEFDFSQQPNLKNPKQLSLDHFSQKEALSIYKGALYVTDESTGGFGNLYRYTPEQTSSIPKSRPENGIKVISTTTSCYIENPRLLSLEIGLFDMSGRLIGQITQRNGRRIEIEKNNGRTIISPGIYWLHIQHKGTKPLVKKVVIGR